MDFHLTLAEVAELHNFLKKHKKCLDKKHPGHIHRRAYTFEVAKPGNGIGEVYEVTCTGCGDQSTIADVESW